MEGGSAGGLRHWTRWVSSRVWRLRWAIAAAGVLSTTVWLYAKMHQAYRSAVGMASEEALEVLQAHLQPEADAMKDASVGSKVQAFGLAINMFGYNIEPPPNTTFPKVELPTLLSAAKYMRFASAAYGPALINDVFFPGLGMVALKKDLLESDPDIGSRHAIVLHTGLSEADIVKMDLLGSDLDSAFSPSYYIAVDPPARQVLLCIRGTMTVQDAITDLLADHEPLADTGGRAHRGMLRLARTLLSATEDVILEVTALPRLATLARAIPWDSLRIRLLHSVDTPVGHAAAVALPPLSCRHRRSSNKLSSVARLTATTLLSAGPPPQTLSSRRADSLVVLGHSLGAGAAALYTLLFRRKHPTVRVECHAFACPAVASSAVWADADAADIHTYVLQDDVVPRLSLESVSHFQRLVVWLSLHEQDGRVRGMAVRPWEWLFGRPPPRLERLARSLVEELKHPVTLLPPPNVVYLRAFNESCSQISAERCGSEWFSQLVISSRMLTDHLPWHYEEALAAAIAAWDCEALSA